MERGKVTSTGCPDEIINIYLGERKINHKDNLIGEYRPTSIQEKLIKSLSIKSGFLEEKYNFRMDEEIILDIRLSEIINYGGSTFLGIGINNWRDQRIFTLMSYNGKITVNNQKINFIRCRIPENHLMPGTYLIKISLILNGIEKDVIINYPGFEIIAHDYFRSGKLPSSTQGVVIKDAYWEFLNEN